MLLPALVAMTAALLISTLIHPLTDFSQEDYSSPIYNGIIHLLTKIGGAHAVYVFFLLSLLLLSLQALLINHFTNQMKLFPKMTYVPALVYLLCASLFRDYLYFNPILLVNTFIIWIVILLFSIYKAKNCFSELFNIGVLIGISALIYFPAISLMLLFFVGLVSLRPFVWREWMAGVIGCATPFFLAGTFFFWNDQLAHFLLATFESVFAEFRVAIRSGPELIWIGSEITLLLAASVYLLQQNFLKHPVQFRKFLTLMLWNIVILLFSTLFLSRVTLTHFLIISVPLSIILTYYFLYLKNRYIPEVLFWVVLLSIVTFHYIY